MTETKATETKAPEKTTAGPSKDFSPQDTPEVVKGRIETTLEEKGGFGPMPGRWQCPLCKATTLERNNKRHLEKQHKLTSDEIEQVLETGLPPTEPEPVFPNALGAIITEFAVMGMTITKRRYFDDEDVVFTMPLDHVEQLSELHQALAEKYLGPMVGEYSLEVACLTIWGTALYANFAGRLTPPKPAGD